MAKEIAPMKTANEQMIFSMTESGPTEGVFIIVVRDQYKAVVYCCPTLVYSCGG